ncbi:5-methylthioadenosine/S-adenosylhomocysteine deaminase [Brevibacillus reuszeri]|uniref:5-methylthioadenosine/S-adenosylhomocysteine deaminase n=1 Tax=Brevibacillus reuszeri TaxID=54915 RepID=A0A0K9YWX4_9BACL|nr:amidohydrolase [Brevibacillus reuszeri]KNB73219.1 amidohydrolase [Brevibacillus reuszeri]MED1856823.1 amidohydrolase [Brevibacillus reuszeri]GED68428.1 5-methylthioadenosine/S-adenosylhomocysteine deaminase [Brevibacillus reuszeri]
MKVDLIIAHAFVLTMEGAGVGIVENGAVAINGDSIAAVGATDEILAGYQADRVIDASGKLVMPGLIDAHMHTGLSIFRGMAQDMSHWMRKGMWPLMKNSTKEETLKGSLVTIIEGIKAGTTTFCDFDHSMGRIVSHYAKIGARARVAETVNELSDDIGKLPVGELYPLDPAIGNRKLVANIKLFEEWHGKENGRITCLFGPQGADMLGKELLLEVKALAQKYDTRIHMHVAQGDREIEQMVKRHQKRTIPYLDELGYLDSRLMAVHLTEATKEETQLVAKRGASMIYCAGSIGIIDGLVPPIMDFLEAGGQAALGSDQAPGNNCNNMFNEMKFAAILNKVKRADPKVFPAWLSLRLATIESAKAIGLDHEVGSLKAGKKADVIILDLEAPTLCPIYTDPIRNIVPNLVYSARGNEVETVLIDGQVIMENRKLLTVDEKEAFRQAQEAADQISRRSRDDIAAADSDVYRMMEDGYL